jgi:anaerobic selenocysteine-containing dehydrogenase
MDIAKVARELNGYAVDDMVDDKGVVLAKKGDLFNSFARLTNDGKTACGCWIYGGYYYPMPDGAGNTLPAAKRRGQKDPGDLGVFPYWGYAWPVNRRIIYNRCSADANGKPWPGGRDLIWWDANADSGTKDADGKPILGKWVGYDVPDFAVTKAPDAAGGKDPFIMRTDGKGGLFAAMNEGPLPAHYEPLESPTTNLLYPNHPINPAIKMWKTDADKSVGDAIGTPDKFPIVATTYRVVEHWQAGGMSRWLEWLAEAQPDMFVEISEELAKEKGIENGAKVKVSSARGTIEAVAIVTKRFKTFKINGQDVHHVGMPWHFGWGGGGPLEALAKGDSANDLTPHVGDANTMIPEYKAFLVDVEKA